MSLQVWLPLNGSLVNNGVGTLSLSNTPNSWGTSGKIGKCATFAGNTSNICYDNTATYLYYTDNYSWCCWVNTNYTGTAGQWAFTSGRADYGGYGYGFRCTSTTNCNIRHGNAEWSVAVTGGEWTHLAVTKSGTTVKIYKNGSLYSTNTFSGTAPTYSDANGFGIGGFHYSGNIYPFYGSLNDFRIYDNCLSPREVKEISKALVLHYPLNTRLPKTNIEANNQSSYTIYNNYGNTASITATGEYFKSSPVYRLTMTAPSGSSALSSIKGSLDNQGVYGWSQTFKASTKYCFWIFYKPVTHTNIRVGGTASNIGGWTEIAPTKYNSDNWYVVGQYRSGSVTSDKSDNIFTSFYCSTLSAGDVISIDFCAPHLIEGYTSIIDDYFASSVDLTIYDGSGYGYNGLADSGYSPILTNDSPRYDYCYNFDGTQYLYCKDNSWAINGITEQSVSLWGYMSSWSSYNAPMFSSTETGGFNCEPSSTGSIRFQVCMFKASDMSASSYSSSVADTTYSLSSLSSGWHLFSFVYTTSSLKIYIDGSEVKSTTYTSYGINHTAYNSSKYLFLCTEANGTNPSSTKLICKLSDFRIYNTALSASDIKELYNTPITFTNTGATMTQGELIES